MFGKKKTLTVPEYREEPVKPAIYTMLVVVVIIAAPLGWLNQKIGAEGFKVADTTSYQGLISDVRRDVRTIESILNNELVDEKILIGATVPVVTLITPDIGPTNAEESVGQNTSFEVELSGIYWSSRDPIVTLDGENYHVGEQIKGHKIIEIRKTEVVFESPTGDKIMKYFYEYLPKSRKGNR
jgi:hypothetical protein